MLQKVWSTFQLAIFEFVTLGTGNAIIEAVAGSGKTTTIVEAMSRLAFGVQAIFLAFNKSIAEELKARGVNARTFHSLCYSAVTRHFRARNIEMNKVRQLSEEFFNGGEARMYGSFCVRLVGLARQAGIGCLVHDTPEEWLALVEHHDIELDNEHASIERGIELAAQLLRVSNDACERGLLDFDDLLYQAVREGITLPRFDFVFVDEAQDTNAIQRAILRKIMLPQSRLVAVGDPAQAIYGFRGADSESLNLIAEEFNCTRLPLTVSYRCPRSVVEYARQWVSHIEPSPTAEEGTVRQLRSWDVSKDFQPNDLIVCRTTRPLIATAYAFLKARVACRIMGREIGQSLKTLINKMNARGIERLIQKLNDHTTREVEKAIAKGQESKAEAIRDKTDAVLCLIDGLPETDSTIPALLALIDSLFADVRNAVVLATIHKAKGLEAERVFWLNRGQCPAKWARQPWQAQQEKNLCYVATTRAKSELVTIEEDGRKS